MENEMAKKEESDARSLQMEHLERYGIFDKDAATPPTKDQHKRKTKQKKTKHSIYDEESDLELDLHGYTVDETLALVEEHLELMEAHRLKTLRLIHGGGHPSYGPLKRALDRNIRSRWNHRVRAFYTERWNAGSSILVLK
jgi:DNA-nicking Smr family endonuclease